jgi:hypothetical protein
MPKGAGRAPFEHETTLSQGQGRYFLTVFLTVAAFLSGAAFFTVSVFS